MADGITAANANAALTTWTGSAVFVQLHTGPPGASGTANISSVTTRMAVTWAAPAAGNIAASNTPTWSGWTGTDGERVTDLSFWTAATSGTFEFSVPLLPPSPGAAAGATVHTGDILQLANLAVAVPVGS